MLFGTQTINTKGHLEIGGVDTVDLAERFGTPLYVFDEDAFRARCREYTEAFEQEAPGTIVSFASKAFLCRAAARLVADEGMHVDVASLGELLTVISAGVDPAAITFHGNYKKDEDITGGLDAGVGLFAIDSVDEMERLSELAAARCTRQRAVIRVAPGIDAHTLDAISTGRNDTKFGITVETGAALDAVRKCLALPGIELVGLHAHIGSQICTLEPFELLADRMMDFSKALSDELNWSPELVILGGGLGVHYPKAKPPSAADLARTLAASVRRSTSSRGLPLPRLALEPGRSIAAEAGTTLYRVGPIKEVPAEGGGSRTYVTVDGGLSDNPRPLLYGATYPVVIANRANDNGAQIVRLAGRHCETDTLFDAELPMPRSGDLLAFLTTGAYNHVMASNYNAFYRPAVVFVRQGDAREVVRRETQEDLLARDIL